MPPCLKTERLKNKVVTLLRNLHASMYKIIILLFYNNPESDYVKYETYFFNYSIFGQI